MIVDNLVAESTEGKSLEPEYAPRLQSIQMAAALNAEDYKGSELIDVGPAGGDYSGAFPADELRVLVNKAEAIVGIGPRRYAFRYSHREPDCGRS